LLPFLRAAKTLNRRGGKFGVGCKSNKDVSVNAIINTDGNAMSVDVIGDNASDKCKKYLIKWFTAQKFIPAVHHGIAINSFYSEKIFSNFRSQ